MDRRTVSLKPGYRVIIRKNTNILENSDTNDAVRFLSPSSTLALYCFLDGMTVDEAVAYLSEVFGTESDRIRVKVHGFLDKLCDFVDIQCRSCDGASDRPIAGVHLAPRHFQCNPHPYGMVKRSYVPEKIVFNITDYCPRECIYCFNGAKCVQKYKIQDDFLSLQRFDEVLQEAKNLGVRFIEIGGGDPFVRPDIADYLEICDRYFPGAWGTSTKALVSRSVARRLARLSSADIQISLDTFDEQIADTLMGVPGSMRQVLQSFQNLMDVGILPSAKMVITALNCHLIKESFYRFADMGIRTIRANAYMASPNRHDEALYPTDAQLQAYNADVSEILAYADANGITTDIAEIKIPMPVKRGSEDRRVLCGASTTDMYIRYDGVMLFCGQMNNCEALTIGDLKKKSIMELWHSDRLNELYHPDFLRARYKGTQCETCADYHKCYPRRCFVRTHAVFGTFFNIDPECPYGIEGYVNRG